MPHNIIIQDTFHLNSGRKNNRNDKKLLAIYVLSQKKIIFATINNIYQYAEH